MDNSTTWAPNEPSGCFYSESIYLTEFKTDSSGFYFRAIRG